MIKRLRQNQMGSALILFVIAGVLLLVTAVLAYVWLHQPQQNKVSSQSTAQTAAQPATSTQTQQAATLRTQDTTKLPLGDGKISSSPKKGYVYSCQTSFRGGGAEHAGSWIDGNFWNLQTKPHVDGEVYWKTAKMDITLNGNQRTLSGNGLPVQLPTGIFPIQVGSTAYSYDRNPNSIKSQTVFYRLPANPTQTTPSCVGMGVIGYMTDGVALFNALDDAGRDAVAHEIQDTCDGHPQIQGVYHYHGLSSCIEKTEGNNQLIGYALDGFGIFGNKDAAGNVITSDDLDECHGITSKIMWDGKEVSMYHYVLTHDYPYSIGCFRGSPVRATR